MVDEGLPEWEKIGGEVSFDLIEMEMLCRGLGRLYEEFRREVRSGRLRNA